MGEFRRTIVTLGVASIGGALFNLAGVPLAWTLGSLSFTLVGAVSHGKTYIPKHARNVAVPVLGVLIGSTFSAELVERIGQWFLVFLMAFGFLICSISSGTLYFRRVLGVDRGTAFCAALPGGLSQVIVMGPTFGADIKTVVLSQLVRIVVLMFTIPVAFRLMTSDFAGMAVEKASNADPVTLSEAVILLACGVGGYFFGSYMRLPAAALTGPMLFSAATHLMDFSHVAPPSWLIAMVQIVIGAIAGSRFVGHRLAETPRILAAGAGWAAILLVMSLAFAVFGRWLTNMDLSLLVLGFAPGGVQEMTLISMVLGMDVAFVSTIHIARISLITGLILPLYPLITRHKSKAP